MIIGSGVSTSVLELLELARQATGAPLVCHHAPAKMGEMRRVVVDNSRARSFGWRPTIDLRAGLADVWGQWEVDVDLSSAAALG
jgi:nucleoside-diphosphate-sugar epimerase